MNYGKSALPKKMFVGNGAPKRYLRKERCGSENILENGIRKKPFEKNTIEKWIFQ